MKSQQRNRFVPQVVRLEDRNTPNVDFMSLSSVGYVGDPIGVDTVTFSGPDVPVGGASLISVKLNGEELTSSLVVSYEPVNVYLDPGDYLTIEPAGLNVILWENGAPVLVTGPWTNVPETPPVVITPPLELIPVSLPLPVLNPEPVITPLMATTPEPVVSVLDPAPVVLPLLGPFAPFVLMGPDTGKNTAFMPLFTGQILLPPVPESLLLPDLHNRWEMPSTASATPVALADDLTPFEGVMMEPLLQL